ncbi:FecCD family ABC transporter permease [Loigolactobacillus rennini]|uniref:Iron chelating ABC transporter n=2 Tax=Loigolactobacillus rennini TaxID=238013 RepID=A0A0R2D0L8_9LACO|nr:iron ABC transporter permease [Loigolactobacillus rennini]KRM95428.1 iron chelating ABC transporter [Loigolactobacillus rennini DSM 20253]SFZ87003.1 Vitamin B12 ABC transporter, permease component BtuC [Loigolactobacillus rennini]
MILKKPRFSYRQFLIGSGLLLLIVMFGALSVGRYPLSFTTISHFFLHPLQLAPAVAATDQQILLELRLPRILAAAIIGAALAISGTAFQAIFHNPLVSPDLLGVSNGAAAGAALAIILGYQAAGIQISAFAGGLLAVLAAVSIQHFLNSRGSLTLVLAGIIISGFMQAVIGLLKYVADPEQQLPSITYWQLGSLEKVTLSNLGLNVPTLLLAGIVLLAFRWRLNLLSLNQLEATTLGANLKLEQGIIILCATVLTASAVCLSGTIGWIGLVVPHAARLVIGQNNAKALPLAGIFGAIFLLLLDSLARSLSAGEIPLGILTGFIGTPLFVWLLLKKRVTFV